MRSMFVSSLLALAVPVVACVDPQQDYNDYVNRTADAHAPPPVATFDAGGETGPLYAPDAGFMSGTFLQECLTANANGDVTKASMFVADVNYQPNMGGGGGKITFSNQTLKNPGAKTLSDTTGMSFTATPTMADVAADGTVTLSFGTTTIPADANPVTDMDLVFDYTHLGFHIESENQICSSLDAHVKLPTPAPVTGTCIFRLLPSKTTPLPTFQLSDFHCP